MGLSTLWSSLAILDSIFLETQEIRAGLRKCTSIQVLDATLASARGKFRGLHSQTVTVLSRRQDSKRTWQVDVHERVRGW